MVSNAKRMRYVSDDSSSDSENGGDFQQGAKGHSRRNKTKCLSRNALMARENRLKKKMYVSSLEDEVRQLRDANRKLTKVVDNQSHLIVDLRNEIKYLKSILANSADISNLIRTIRYSTGMSVSSSLDRNLSLNNSYVSTKKQPIARKTAHPWEENAAYPNIPTPDLSDSPKSEEFDNMNLLDDDDDDDLRLNSFSLDIPNDLDKTIEFDDFQYQNSIPNELLMEEHNYTTNQNDVGVCLHVSKHRVSLEFCSSCSENASSAWMELE